MHTCGSGSIIMVLRLAVLLLFITSGHNAALQMTGKKEKTVPNVFLFMQCTFQSNSIASTVHTAFQRSQEIYSHFENGGQRQH